MLSLTLLSCANGGPVEDYNGAGDDSATPDGDGSIDAPYADDGAAPIRDSGGGRDGTAGGDDVASADGGVADSNEDVTDAGSQVADAGSDEDSGEATESGAVDSGGLGADASGSNCGPTTCNNGCCWGGSCVSPAQSTYQVCATAVGGATCEDCASQGNSTECFCASNLCVCL